MQRFLEKISWKFRRVEIAFTPMFLKWSGSGSYFTFSICKIHNGLRTYSLFELDLLLPNKTTHKYFQIYSWDFLFLRGYLLYLSDILSDKEVWNRRRMTSWDKFKLKILNKIL
jgi:uncharacterized membrane protein YbhN (UPF0104 family)